MVVAIDLDGTSFAYPDLFAHLMRSLQAQGHTVGILTAHHVSRQQEDLFQLFQLGFPKPDFYIGKHTDELSIPSKRWKPKVMHELGIEYLFDDYNSDEIKLISTKESLQDGTRPERLWPRWRL